MKAVKIVLCGREYYLLFNGYAMFECEEKYGGAAQLISEVQQPGRTGFEKLCEAIAMLAEQGELVRRDLGYDHGEMPLAEHIRAAVTPLEIVTLRKALVSAVMIGFEREVEPDEDIDLVLLELTQKKTKA